MVSHGHPARWFPGDWSTILEASHVTQKVSTIVSTDSVHELAIER